MSPKGETIMANTNTTTTSTAKRKVSTLCTDVSCGKARRLAVHACPLGGQAIPFRAPTSDLMPHVVVFGSLPEHAVKSLRKCGRVVVVGSGKHRRGRPGTQSPVFRAGRCWLAPADCLASSMSGIHNCRFIAHASNVRWDTDAIMAATISDGR